MTLGFIGRFFPMPLLKVFLYLILICSSAYVAAEGRIAVAYPELREPYNQIFLSLQRGVEDHINRKSLVYPLTSETQADDFLKWLEAKKVSGVVALGNRGLNLALDIQEKIKVPIVVGGTFFDGDSTGLLSPSLSMAPAPLPLFKHLLKLAPNTDTINVIYQAEDEWLIGRARDAAKELNIHLNAVVAVDIQQLAVAYKTILAAQKSNTQALWLPYSGKSLEKALLNEVLEKAWTRDLTVFSSNLADVSKGVLFSLYPSNELGGQHLAKLLIDQMDVKKARTHTLHLSENLFSALNIRTAEHLGIRIGSSEKSEYQILFPLKR